MALFKCKMCGGDLEIAEGLTIAECEYCGTKQTVPKAADENLQNIFNRANTLRIKSEFDKAEKLYEKIIQTDESQAEAYWGLILCKYGIEYVDDPATFKKIPTCHRASYDSIIADEDYKSALENADAGQRGLYEEQAREIDRIQKDILALAQKEENYDVFICYKETDASGHRTQDGVIANDIYYQLTNEGFKVFYAAITLEGKLGSAYEPIIFAALNSAKVMLSIGTKPEYFNAVWVKNEWSRFLKIIQKDRSKLLIPCYRDMDAYELPEEFAHLQAQDMSKIGFINDLVRGIKKVIQKDEPKQTTIKETVVATANANTAPLLKRAFMFLEDGEWDRADDFCEQVLNIDPENAQAYLGKLMAELRVKEQDQLNDQAESFAHNNNYQKAIRFANEDLKAALDGYIENINTRNENARLEGIYTRAQKAMAMAQSDRAFYEAAQIFDSISHYMDSVSLAEECRNKAEDARKDAIYVDGRIQANNSGNSISRLEGAIKTLQKVSGWKDADELLAKCQSRVEEIKAKAEADRLECERKAEIARQKAERIAKRNKKIAIITTPIVCAIIAFVIVLNTVIIPNGKYKNAIALMDAGKYTEAIAAFEALNGYKDSQDKIAECNTAILDEQYSDALDLMEVGKYSEAISTFEALGGYKDSAAKITECNTAILDEQYSDALDLMEAGQYSKAVSVFEALGGYKDSRDKAVESKYEHATALMNAGQTAQAAMLFGQITGFLDAKSKSYFLWEKIVERHSISVSPAYTIGLQADGTVVATGANDFGQRNVSSWKNIIDISSDGSSAVGLRADGTVVAVGKNDYGQCDVSGWKDIVAISTGDYTTVGLRADGTVVAVGKYSSGRHDVSGWTNIVAISAGLWHTVGLRADGTVVAVGDNDYGQCDVSGWKDIVAISTGNYTTVGLRADGTVVAVGKNNYGQCDVSGWKDIVAIGAGSAHTIGLQANGTVIAVGNNKLGQCNVSKWKHIVSISAASYDSFGIQANGTVIFASGENNMFGNYNVSGWKNIKVPN